MLSFPKPWWWAQCTSTEVWHLQISSSEPMLSGQMTYHLCLLSKIYCQSHHRCRCHWVLVSSCQRGYSRCCFQPLDEDCELASGLSWCYRSRRELSSCRGNCQESNISLIEIITVRLAVLLRCKSAINWAVDGRREDFIQSHHLPKSFDCQ